MTGAGAEGRVTETTEFDYDVALSFAGEDRPVVDELAASLRGESVRVFYDDYETAQLLTTVSKRLPGRGQGERHRKDRRNTQHAGRQIAGKRDLEGVSLTALAHEHQGVAPCQRLQSGQGCPGSAPH